MPSIKTVTVTYHVNEETGKLVNVTRHDGSPGESRVPQGTITDCHAIVLTQNSPTCVWHLINGVWYCF
jgi:hypothetical protein